MILYKIVKKTNEELYESQIRSDFRATRKEAFAICLDDRCLLIGKV